MNTQPPARDLVSGDRPSSELLRAVAAASVDWELRAQESADAAEGRSGKTSWRGRTWLRLGSRRMLAALAFTLLVAGATLGVPRWMRGHPELPGALLGQWQTASAGYAGRAMILSPDSIAIVAGEGLPMQRYPLRLIRRQQQGIHHRYDMEYLTADGPLSLSILVSRGGLRLVNRAEALWTRTAAGR